MSKKKTHTKRVLKKRNSQKKSDQRIFNVKKKEFYIFITVILIFMFLLYIVYVYFYLGVYTMKTYPEELNYKKTTLDNLRNENFPEGNYNINGYVVTQNICPECRKDNNCRQCMAKINIFEFNPKVFSSSLADYKDQFITVLLSQTSADKFKDGRFYEFSIEILDKDNIDEIPDIILEGYSEI